MAFVENFSVESDVKTEVPARVPGVRIPPLPIFLISFIILTRIIKMQESPTYKDILEIILSENEASIKKHLLASKIKNIRISGDYTEQRFRSLLSSLLPQRFGVTTGHIMNSEKKISPQCDIIIVDKMVVHTLLPFDSKDIFFDIVPMESVVAIFEVKSKLNDQKAKEGNEEDSQSIFKAINQLKKIVTEVNISKNNKEKYLLGGNKTSNEEGFCTNPLIGILASEYTLDMTKEKNKQNITNALFESPAIDVIFSPDGFLGTRSNENKDFLIDPSGNNVNSKKRYFAYIDEREGKFEKSQIISKGFAFILTYLQDIVGRCPNIIKYFDFK